MEKVLVILGPTAVGKTKVALEVADILKGEIISADSRQIYKYLDIGTAKPTEEDQKRVAYHLIDIVEPDEKFSASDYAKEAKKIIREVIERNKVPIVVGGSGLYLRALFKGFFKGPKADHNIRERLKKESEKFGTKFLHDRLKEKDPEAALRIHPNDEIRIIRALEVCELTKKTITGLQKKGEYEPEEFEFVKIGLKLDRKRLYERINQRVNQMIKDGLLDEVIKIKQMGYALPQKDLPWKTLGYKELFLYLEGKLTLEKASDLIKRNTRRYAKRQLTWFKKEKDVTWLDADKEGLIFSIMKECLKNA
jgi:tRNA dimethylallyltransferase